MHNRIGIQLALNNSLLDCTAHIFLIGNLLMVHTLASLDDTVKNLLLQNNNYSFWERQNDCKFRSGDSKVDCMIEDLI